METVLIVDDDPRIVESISHALKDEGYSFITDSSGRSTVSLLQSEEISLVILDLFLGDINGLDLLNEIRLKFEAINVVIISGESDIETAIAAVRSGAYDFLEKPFNRNKLRVTVKNALLDSSKRGENLRFINQMLDQHSFGGDSGSIREVERLIERAAASNISVMLTGENGTGKEIAARRLHYRSGRASMPFVAINCASIPKDLLESEMFGYKKGAFTGAASDRDGLFLKADRGTLFLDEIGEMPVELQPKLLRIIQEREILRIGDSVPVKIDVRIISATNRDTGEMISSGILREDLYYRLCGLEIHIPPLRERKSDINFLVRKFIMEFCSENNLAIPEVAETALKELCDYDFPGNVRELRNIVQRSVVLHENGLIERFNIPAIEGSGCEDETYSGTLQEIKQSLLKNYLHRRLKDLNGDKKRLAGELGIHVNNLYRLI